MKHLFIFSFILLIGSNAVSQVTKGTNYFFFSNNVFTPEAKQFEKYPYVEDTTNTSNTSSSSSVNLYMGYSVALSKRFSIGVKSRFLNDKSSTYGISCAGPILRYYFGVGKEKTAKEIEKRAKAGNPVKVLSFLKSGENARKFFFIETGSMFGNKRFESSKIAYQEYNLSAGASVRIPTDAKLVGKLGFEASLGGTLRTNLSGNLDFVPSINIGLQIYFDKKYTQLK